MSISERRTDRLVNPDLNEGLPAFLAPQAGTQSGFMILHVAAVALLNEAKVLAHPASVDNVPTSGGKEDHVSMGMTAALKLRTIVENAEHLLAIELLCGRGSARVSAALERRRRRRAGLRTGPINFAPLWMRIVRCRSILRAWRRRFANGEFDSETRKDMSGKRVIRAPRGQRKELQRLASGGCAPDADEQSRSGSGGRIRTS